MSDIHVLGNFTENRILELEIDSLFWKELFWKSVFLAKLFVNRKRVVLS